MPRTDHATSVPSARRAAQPMRKVHALCMLSVRREAHPSCMPMPHACQWTPKGLLATLRSPSVCKVYP